MEEPTPAAIIETPAEKTPPPPVERITLEKDNLPEGDTFVVNVKKEGDTFGLRIAGGKGKPFGGGFIYVKSLVKGTPAEKCNMLKEHDIILKVYNLSLIHI